MAKSISDLITEGNLKALEKAEKLSADLRDVLADVGVAPGSECDMKLRRDLEQIANNVNYNLDKTRKAYEGEEG